MTYNPEEVGYDRLVDLFYSRHNSTTPNRSGNDSGTQYRSGIYYHNEEQKQVRAQVVKRSLFMLILSQATDCIQCPTQDMILSQATDCICVEHMTCLICDNLTGQTVLHII